MSRLKGSSFFCEDLRIEASGQPMFIGVMSPKFGVNGLPTRLRSLFFTSLFYVDNASRDTPLKLEISVEGCDEDNSNVCGTFHRTISDEMLEEDAETLVVISLPIHGVNVCDGSTIVAKLSYRDVSEEFRLTTVDVSSDSQ